MALRSGIFHIALVHGMAMVSGDVAGGPDTWLRGIDVSRWQGAIDWPTVRSVGNITFACTKATEGLHYVDPTFATNWAGMHAAGIVRCAYHYANVSESPSAQAEHFVSTVSALGYRNSRTLQFMLDLEDTKSVRSPSAIWEWVQEFMGNVEKLTGRPGIIYVGYYFWVGNVGNPTNNLNAPLWLPWYTHPLPKAVPAAWPSGWTFWQYDDNGAAYPGAPAGKVPGVQGNVDVDYFKYSFETLLKFCFP
jgi:lysozyme